MSEVVSVTYPREPCQVTLSLSRDGLATVEMRSRSGKLLDRAEGRITPPRANRVILNLLSASQRNLPPGVEIQAVHDETTDSVASNADIGELLQPARELAAEVLREHGTRPTEASYGPLSFLLWTGIFGVVLAAAVAVAEFLSQHFGGSMIEALSQQGKITPGGVIAFIVLLLFGFGVAADRFNGTYRRGHPIWPALVATTPVIFGAHATAGWVGVTTLSLCLALPLLLVGFGVAALNPGNRPSRDYEWFNWRGWY